MQRGVGEEIRDQDPPHPGANMGDTPKTRLIILGAAGRDFHDFNVRWKDDPTVEVVAFTATQIPDIDSRVYPASLAGPRYPQGIPIHPEAHLEQLIRDLDADLVAFSYSDASYEHVMHLAARAQAAGAGFRLLAPREAMIPSVKPVISIGAARTGCGKSQTARRIAAILHDLGLRVGVIRHPMPYGDLSSQALQRFASVADMDRHHCTIEEREEYEPHIAMGSVVFAGVDYDTILRAAEAESDVILWDGGNNDVPFYRPDLHVVVVDPHRPGHELRYYPGETNLRMADVVIINKVDTADPEDVAVVERDVRAVNPHALVVFADSPPRVDRPDLVRDRRALVIEDGPTLTHGEMPYGAGMIAARRLRATLVDPRPFAIGSIRETFMKYSHLVHALPAMGYGERQVAELCATIERVPCDVVLIATPIDLTRHMTIPRPTARVTYELEEHDRGALPRAIGEMLAMRGVYGESRSGEPQGLVAKAAPAA
jgi:predicted GTPase